MRIEQHLYFIFLGQDLKDIFPDIWHRDPSPSLSDLEKSFRKLIVDAGMTTLACEVYSTEAYYPTLEVLLGELCEFFVYRKAEQKDTQRTFSAAMCYASSAVQISNRVYR